MVLVSLLKQDLSLFSGCLDTWYHFVLSRSKSLSWKAALHVQRRILSRSQRSEGSDRCVYTHSVLLQVEACSAPYDRPCNEAVDKRLEHT